MIFFPTTLFYVSKYFIINIYYFRVNKIEISKWKDKKHITKNLLQQYQTVGEGNGNPLQYFCLKNHLDRGAWQATYNPWGN